MATAMEEDPKDFGFFFLQRSEADGDDSVLSSTNFDRAVVWIKQST